MLEYKVISVSFVMYLEYLEKELNNLASEGWELVTTISGENSSRLILKRTANAKLLYEKELK